MIPPADRRNAKQCTYTGYDGQPRLTRCSVQVTGDQERRTHVRNVILTGKHVVERLQTPNQLDVFTA